MVIKMGRAKHGRGYWKTFFNSFRYGLSCEFEKNAKKIFWKYHEKGAIKRSKFRISVEINGKLYQGYLYYKGISEEEAWLKWLKTHSEDTYKAIKHIQKHKIVVQYELEKKYPNLITAILTTFGHHNFLIKRHFICSGKPIIFCDVSVSKEELDKFIENDLQKFLYGKKAEEVKEGHKFQKDVFNIIKHRLEECNYQVLTIEYEKYFKVDGHNVRFDIFGILRSPAFNTPMFFVIEVKNYVLNYKHISHLLMLDYKVKRVFGNVPVMKFIICRGANPQELFKRAYELGINLMTAYERKANKELVIYPKRRGNNETF